MNQQDIYGWHIIHAETGVGVGFCPRVDGQSELTVEDILKYFSQPEQLELIPLARAYTVN